MAQPNIYVLASDNSPALLPLLRSNPQLASSQDEHGYSLLHAAVSWGHIDLLRTLVREFKVDVNMTDEDGDTCLFVAESLDIAKCLVEELGIDKNIKNDEGLTAAEHIMSEGTFGDVAVYLMGGEAPAIPTPSGNAEGELPSNIRVNFNTVPEQSLGDAEPDPELRRRIEELAAKDTFHTPEGQAELRALVQEALGKVNTENDERNVKRREE
ncbi:Ankyrin repeat-containing domain protein [Ascosphaera apis ARSEF 7405]|uniref:Ankyrin repeat-containing domain protein n=1 Tax=Ascosphaera apis ARSEF 7405 TaxID=392613 RepID=A0A166NNF2_9EURO|nr:Ankyrin repeat-containing domain protein [Ascosphaera apis ARSEF 7405]